MTHLFRLIALAALAGCYNAAPWCTRHTPCGARNCAPGHRWSDSAHTCVPRDSTPARTR